MELTTPILGSLISHCTEERIGRRVQSLKFEEERFKSSFFNQDFLTLSTSIASDISNKKEFEK